jgi:ankyrin repeat protein
MDIYYDIFKNDMKTLVYKLNNGGSPDEKDYKHRSAIVSSIMCDNIQAFCILMTYGARINDIDQFKCTALHWACIYKQKEIVRLLLINGASVNNKNIRGNTAFDCVLKTESKDIIVLFLNHISYSVLCNKYLEYIEDRNYKMLDVLTCPRLIKDNEMTFLLVPIVKNDSHLLYKLLSFFKKKGRSSFNGRAPWIDILSHRAIELFSNNCLDMLLPLLRNINEVDITGNTLLHTATYSDNTEAINILLKLEVDPCILNCHNKYPMYGCVINENIFGIYRLLKFNFNMNQLDYVGKNIVQHVQDTRNKEVFNIFYLALNLENLYRCLKQEREFIEKLQKYNPDFVETSQLLKLKEKIQDCWYPVSAMLFLLCNKQFEYIGKNIKSFVC